MFYKCNRCGNIFEDGEEVVWLESCGEVSGCPICRGSYDECEQCEICGSYHLKEELNSGVCDKCLDSLRNNFEECYKISLGDNSEIEINALLATIFEPGDIEQILIWFIKNQCKDLDFSEYIDADREWFAEQWLRKTEKENKK